MTFEQAVQLYGPWAAAFGLFFYFQLWPALKPVLVAWLRPERAEKRRQEIEQAEQARRQEDRQREDRLFIAFEKMIEVITSLRIMSETQAKVGEATAEAVHDLAVNVAELRGQLNQPRPRTREKVKVADAG